MMNLSKLQLPLALAPFAVVSAVVAALSGAIWGPPGYVAPGCILAIGLAWVTYIDIDRLILPDALTLALIAIGLAVRTFGESDGWSDYYIGALAGFGSLATVALLYEKSRGRAGLGLGDAKLFSASGAWLGWASLPTVLIAASVIGLVGAIVLTLLDRTRTLRTRFAFGPFLACATWLVWLFGPLPSQLFE